MKGDTSARTKKDFLSMIMFNVNAAAYLSKYELRVIDYFADHINGAIGTELLQNLSIAIDNERNQGYTQSPLQLLLLSDTALNDASLKVYPIVIDYRVTGKLMKFCTQADVTNIKEASVFIKTAHPNKSYTEVYNSMNPTVTLSQYITYLPSRYIKPDMTDNDKELVACCHFIAQRNRETRHETPVPLAISHIIHGGPLLSDESFDRLARYVWRFCSVNLQSAVQDGTISEAVIEEACQQYGDTFLKNIFASEGTPAQEPTPIPVPMPKIQTPSPKSNLKYIDEGLSEHDLAGYVRRAVPHLEIVSDSDVVAALRLACQNGYLDRSDPNSRIKNELDLVNEISRVYQKSKFTLKVDPEMKTKNLYQLLLGYDVLNFYRKVNEANDPMSQLLNDYNWCIDGVLAGEFDPWVNPWGDHDCPHCDTFVSPNLGAVVTPCYHVPRAFLLTRKAIEDYLNDHPTMLDFDELAWKHGVVPWALKCAYVLDRLNPSLYKGKGNGTYNLILMHELREKSERR